MPIQVSRLPNSGVKGAHSGATGARYFQVNCDQPTEQVRQASNGTYTDHNIFGLNLYSSMKA